MRGSVLKANSILKNKKLNCRIVGLSETEEVTDTSTKENGSESSDHLIEIVTI